MLTIYTDVLSSLCQTEKNWCSPMCPPWHKEELEELYIHATEYCAASKKQRLNLLSTFCMLNLFIIMSFKDFPGGLISQLVQNPPAMQETPIQFLGQRICWRRDRLPTPVFLDFPCGSTGKEYACIAGDLGLIPGWEDPLEKGKATHSSIGLYSPWGHKEPDTAEQLSLARWTLGSWINLKWLHCLWPRHSWGYLGPKAWVTAHIHWVYNVICQWCYHWGISGVIAWYWH